jgi:uncharacterized membrane protein
MELSRTIGTVAVVLGVVLAAGFAVGEDGGPAMRQATLAQATTTQEAAKTGQMKIEEREAQRRVALKEQQERKDAFERACNKPLKTDMDFDLCRNAYKRLQLTQ